MSEGVAWRDVNLAGFEGRDRKGAEEVFAVWAWGAEEVEIAGLRIQKRGVRIEREEKAEREAAEVAMEMKNRKRVPISELLEP